jgi:DNA-binding NtrC family response regulator
MKPHKIKESIFIVDDEPEILIAIETTLKMAGKGNVITIEDSRDVMARLEQDPPCLIILDLNMPYINGEKVLAAICNEYPNIPVIILTGTIDVETVVRCMKIGVMDYVVKPVEEERLLAAVDNALVYYQIEHIPAEPEENNFNSILISKAFEHIITQHDAMHSVFRYIRAVAPSSQPVLILGETGVGKELIGRSLHSLGERKGQLVTVNVAGLDDNMFSDTLFGHVKGAFTGADITREGLIDKAENGTLFLDEIGDLTLSSQVKLLRILQEKEYFPLGSDKIRHAKIRIIASTNQDLWALEKKGLFRKDLIYRLSTHTINIPPLRERICDLPLLLNQFIHHAADELGKPIPRVSKHLVEQMETYPFEGNIRELRSMVYDAVIKYTDGLLTPDLFTRLCDPIGHRVGKRTFGSKLPTLREASDHLVEKAMAQTDNNQSAAAKILGISQQALSKRLQKLKSKK